MRRKKNNDWKYTLAPDALLSLIRDEAKVFCPLLFFDLWPHAEICSVAISWGSDVGKDVLLAASSALLSIFRSFISGPGLLWKCLVRYTLKMHIQ